MSFFKLLLKAMENSSPGVQDPLLRQHLKQKEGTKGKTNDKNLILVACLTLLVSQSMQILTTSGPFFFLNSPLNYEEK